MTRSSSRRPPGTPGGGDDGDWSDLPECPTCDGETVPHGRKHYRCLRCGEVFRPDA